MPQVQDIGWAVIQLNNGARVRRSGWNGRGMWLVLVPVGAAPIINKFSGGYPTDEYVAMKTADDHLVPWLCSQRDLLATDWEVLP